jgi:glycosyltransferase involved in cell wall biosynthesis
MRLFAVAGYQWALPWLQSLARLSCLLPMRLCYVLLSPTWGMHQYTADLAGRMQAAGHEVHVVTTRRAPRDRYAPGVTIHTPVAAGNTGFSLDALRPRDLRRLLTTTRALQPDLVHCTGPHLWNPLLLRALRRAGIPTVHTLHDLHPHAGAVYGRLLYLWNGWVRREADHLLVHGQRYRAELLARGKGAKGVTYTPLTHLFVGYAREQALRRFLPEVRYEPWTLCIGRLEAYKGLDVLVEAARRLDSQRLCVVVAGPGRWEQFVRGPLPPNVEVRGRLVEDEEAVDLFARCGLAVLPYVEASQSALVAAAYFFRKPAIVTRAGALPEYVVDGETGWAIPPGDPGALAEALQAALGDPARLAQMGAAGRAWYERQYQAEGIALEEMYAVNVRRSNHFSG